MLVANYTDFRKGLKNYLDEVEKDNQTVFISRSKGKTAVLISLNEYNSLMETLHLLKSETNAGRLYESISQVSEGKVIYSKEPEE